MFEYLTARHRNTYIKLALKYFTSPKHVWSLAHGTHASTAKDREIMHELLDLGIVHRHRKHNIYDQKNTREDLED